MQINRYFSFQEKSVNFGRIYLGQYLELLKVTICKTTELTSVLWEHKYLSLELNNLKETYSIPYAPFFLRRPIGLRFLSLNQAVLGR